MVNSGAVSRKSPLPNSKGALPRKIALVRLLQSRNARPSILVDAIGEGDALQATAADERRFEDRLDTVGNRDALQALQPSIVVMPSGMVTLVRLLQPENAGRRCW